MLIAFSYIYSFIGQRKLFLPHAASRRHIKIYRSQKVPPILLSFSIFILYLTLFLLVSFSPLYIYLSLYLSFYITIFLYLSLFSISFIFRYLSLFLIFLSLSIPLSFSLSLFLIFFISLCQREYIYIYSLCSMPSEK